MRTLNQYYFRKQLGRGAFATVFEAVSLKTQTLVAIKITSEKLKKQEHKLIRKQIETLSRINHNNIIRILDYLIRDTIWYLVLQYCPGGNLHQYINTHPRLAQIEVQTIAYSLGNALLYLQQNRIAHRDIKLANILINEKGEAKLADLGFAKSIDEGQFMRSLAGTRSTMAPEVHKGEGKAEYTTKCDVWSFGVVIYELLTGKNPFDFKSPTFSYDYPQELPRRVSKEAKDLVSKCMKVDPSKRITAAQIMEHPWIKRFIENRAPQYLSVIGAKQQSMVLMINDYQVDLASQRQRQYDWAIVRAIEKFRVEYRGDVVFLSQNFEYALQTMKKVKGLNELLEILFSVVDSRISQLQSILVRVQLPSKSFEISKDFHQEISINKQTIKIIRKQIQMFRLDQKGLHHSIPEDPDFSHEKQLMYRLLKHGECISTKDEHEELWRIIGVVSKILQTNFGVYTVELDYHESLSVQAKRELDEKKSQMTTQQFNDIKKKRRAGIPFQKMDVLKYKISGSTRESKQFFEGTLLKILDKTASGFQS